MSMNEDRFAGTGKNVGGRVEQGFGRAAGDVKTEVEGKIKQATGAAQDVYVQAKEAAADAYGQAKEPAGDAARSVQEHAAPWEEFLRNAIESRPYTSVAVALGSVGLSAVWADIRTTEPLRAAAFQHCSF